MRFALSSHLAGTWIERRRRPFLRRSRTDVAGISDWRDPACSVDIKILKPLRKKDFIKGVLLAWKLWIKRAVDEKWHIVILLHIDIHVLQRVFSVKNSFSDWQTQNPLTTPMYRSEFFLTKDYTGINPWVDLIVVINYIQSFLQFLIITVVYTVFSVCFSTVIYCFFVLSQLPC